MPGKKQAIKIFKGSLKTHWMKYVTAVDLKMNPAEPRGMSLGTMMHRTIHTLDSKFVQPGFKYKQAFMKKNTFYEPSTLDLTFVNGYQRVYYLGMSPWINIKREIDWINDMIEFERNMQGQDDELEDEA